MLSEPRDVRQICAVVDNIEKEMQKVDLNDLAYFVEHQRPTIIQQQMAPPPISVTPIWRQADVVAVPEIKQTAMIPDAAQIARTADSTRFNPIGVYQRGLELLDANHPMGEG